MPRFPPAKFRFNNDPFGIELETLPIRRNNENGFYVLTSHYSQHPKARNEDGSINEEWVKKEKQGLSKAIWDREYEIEYNSMGGELIWGSFNEERHVIDGIKLDDRWWRFRFVDYGYRNPTCCLWIAVDFNGVAYVYKEWYHPSYKDMQRGKAAEKKRYTLKQHAQIILIMSGLEQYIGTYIDPQADEINAGNSTDKKTVLTQLGEYGLHCSKARKSSKGLDSIEEAFKSNKLFIFRDCVNTIAEVKDYRFADFTEAMQQTRNLKDQPVKKNDHAANCLKYYGNQRIHFTPTPVEVRKIPSQLVRVIRPDHEIAKADMDRAKKKLERKQKYARRW